MNEIGRKGEELTAKYLQNKNYEIIEKNYSCRFGEIDLIAKKENFICFIEVKTRKQDAFTTGFEAITVSKQRKIIKTAQYFLAYNKKYQNLQPRFDCVEVNSKTKRITYIKNAF
ncbi:MAG: YraN family protein [Ruminococcaceae bacterium]|mgnify:CR=1 FL=1|nr:YraN family protein [Oscillospiraceae bacterium]